VDLLACVILVSFEISVLNFMLRHSILIYRECVCLFLSLALQPNRGLCPPSFTRFLVHTQRQDSSGRVISSSQRLLPVNAQHTQQTNIHASGGIRTHWDQHRECVSFCNVHVFDPLKRLVFYSIVHQIFLKIVTRFLFYFIYKVTIKEIDTFNVIKTVSVVDTQFVQ
jgi:hypothetical protein